MQSLGSSGVGGDGAYRESGQEPGRSDLGEVVLGREMRNP